MSKTKNNRTARVTRSGRAKLNASKAKSRPTAKPQRSLSATDRIEAEADRIRAEFADPASRRVSLEAAVRDLFDVIFMCGSVDEPQAKAMAIIIDELDEDNSERREKNIRLLLDELIRRTRTGDAAVESFVRNARREYVLNGFGAF